MKKHVLWFGELFIWLLVLFLLAAGIMFVKYGYKRNFDNYQIFLPDVDGLIKGSPVKLMGINIGYVNQIDITGEDVYVRFIVTDSKVRIPYGSTITVEFSGLGGSKSLEIYPPNSSKTVSNKFLITQSPKRIHDSLSVLNRMFDDIVDIAYTISHFMKQIGFIKNNEHKTTQNGKSIDSMINCSNEWLDKLKIQNNKISTKINKIKNGRKKAAKNE